MGRDAPEGATGHALHRPALGVPAVNLDPGPVYMAAADHENTISTSRNGVVTIVLQPHRLSQYWVRLTCFLPSLRYHFT